MQDPKVALIVAGAGALCVGKLILTGACLAIGFSVGNIVVRKVSQCVNFQVLKHLEKEAGKYVHRPGIDVEG